MLTRHERCSQALCWRRGSLWEHDGEWMLECPYRMQQQRFSDMVGIPQKDGQAITPAQLQTKWEKLPSGNEEPSTSSGTTHSTIGAPEGQGMADAAFPDPHQEIKKKEPTSQLQQSEEPTEKKPEGVPHRDSHLHIEEAGRLGDLSDQISQDPAPKKKHRVRKPGILLTGQMAAGLNFSRRWKRVPEPTHRISRKTQEITLIQWATRALGKNCDVAW